MGHCYAGAGRAGLRRAGGMDRPALDIRARGPRLPDRLRARRAPPQGHGGRAGDARRALNRHGSAIVFTY